MTSTTRVLNIATWEYFSSCLPGRFFRSPKVVKEEIMKDINDLVQEFWRTSSGGVVGASLLAMRRLFAILNVRFHNSEGCFDIISVFVNAIRFADKILQMSVLPWNCPLQSQIRANIKMLLDGYRKMLDQSFSKSKDFADVVKFLPGVAVQKGLSKQGMADLYRIKPDLLERLIKFTIEPLKPSLSYIVLDDYLSGFLQDRDRSRLYYCDPMLQHISICRHFLSLLDGSKLQS
jgi:hypothetical protein